MRGIPFSSPASGGGRGEVAVAGLPTARDWAERPNDPSESIKRLQPGERPGTSKVPFEVTDREAYLKSVHATGSVAAKTHGAPTALVNLKDLRAIQNTVNDERLVQHLSDPNMVPPGAKGSGHGGLVDRPVVVKMAQQLYIHDGHHRLTSAHLRGQDTAKVRLVDLDGDVHPGHDRAT